MVAYDFSGRSAIITGGARGIGLGIAQRIAASGGAGRPWGAGGAQLGERKAARGPPEGRIHTAVVDVTDDKAVDRAAAEVEREFGKIDVLVASAGITGPNTTTWEYPVDAWRRVITST